MSDPVEVVLTLHPDAAEVAMLTLSQMGYCPVQRQPDQFKAAYMEWATKTDFMDHLNLPVKYLGWHRADVLRDLITKQVPKPPPKKGTLLDLMQALHGVDARIDWMCAQRAASQAEHDEDTEMLVHLRAYKACLIRLISRRCGAA